eukprot:3143215-Heterocapsa_arctica.AAC.1
MGGMSNTPLSWGSGPSEEVRDATFSASQSAGVSSVWGTVVGEGGSLDWLAVTGIRLRQTRVVWLKVTTPARVGTPAAQKDPGRLARP